MPDDERGGTITADGKMLYFEKSALPHYRESFARTSRSRYHGRGNLYRIFLKYIPNSTNHSVNLSANR